jgi:hypothetical protein
MRPEAMEEILLHLDGCEVCERRLEELEPLLRRYRELRAESLPESPAWRDIGPVLDSVDALKTKSRTSRSAWAGALAAAATICVFLLWPAGRQSELRAETLLREAERSLPMEGSKRRLEVRTAAGSFIRPAVLNGMMAVDPVGVRFTAAHYDWNDPLGPASYGKWWDGLRKKKVSVVEDKGQGRIETDTSEGELVKASLTITENNMRVVAGRFEFADRQWVEIAALPDAEEAPVAASRTPDSFDSSSKEPSPRFVQSLPERELHVWAAIDSLNLGAGTPVNVEVVSQERLLVTADHLDPSEEQLLRARIAGTEGAAVQIANGDAGIAAHAVDPAINASEGILARAHFLARLQSRFPASTEAVLDLADRRMLWKMRMRSVSLLNQDIELLGTKLPKRGNVPLSPATAATVQDLVDSATIVDRLVTGLFANTNADPDRDRVIDEFNKLREMALGYARSLGEEPSR